MDLNMVLGPTPILWHFVNWLNSPYNSGKKWGLFLWKLEPGFWTYGRICLLGPSGPNIVSRPQTPKANFFFEVSWFYWICLMIPEKMRSCLWELEPGFWTYGRIRLLGSSGPNVFPKKLEKIIQKFSFWCHFGYILHTSL